MRKKKLKLKLIENFRETVECDTGEIKEPALNVTSSLSLLSSSLLLFLPDPRATGVPWLHEWAANALEWLISPPPAGIHYLRPDFLSGHHVNQVPGNVYESLCKAIEVVNAYWWQKTAPPLRAADKQCVAA